MLNQFETLEPFESPDQLDRAVDAEMNLEVEGPDPTTPAEVDGVPLDHAGDIFSTEDDPELSQDAPPFDVDAVLREVAG